MNKLYIILSILLISLNSYAKITATVDRNQIVIGETFNLVISVDQNTSEQPDLTALNQVFRVLGTSQSSSTKIINGSYSVEKTWQISLMPNGVGKNTIPPIKLGNESTQPINVEVKKSDPNAKANGDLFIEVTTDKSSAYVKEQIILTVKLFYYIALSEGSLSEPVASSTIITQLDKGATYTTNRDGKNYTVVERHYSLSAEKSGKLDLNPIIFNGRDNTSRRNFSMFSTGKPVRAVSKNLTFEIKPIPQASIGKDWIPAKKVRIAQEWSNPPYAVGEPITRTITLYVEGLSETQIPDIDLGEIDNIRIYPEQPQTQTEKTATTLKAWKQMKIAMIPTQAGKIRIPEFQLEWFNTSTQKIELAKLPPNTIPVSAGDFGVQVPEIADVLDELKTPKETTAVTKQNPVEKEIQIVEKDNAVWKILTAVFALLWLLTVWLFKKNKSTHNSSVTKEVVKISKKQIITAINTQNLGQLQTDLIYWWNQQYPKVQVTNLSQIKNWVNPKMQNLIDGLELQLYHSDNKGNLDKQAWTKLINGKGLEIVKKQKQHQQGNLPSLY